MNSHQPSSFGDLLKLFRQRKKLSQQLLANKIEVHRNSISLWERDMERPETFSTLLHLATVLDLDEEEKRVLIEARFGTISFLSFSNIPFNRNPYFTGREHFLEDLHQQLISGTCVAITQAIVGLGGIGKTQLAVEYVYRYQDSYHTIFWISADTIEATIRAFVEAARHLWLPERNDKDEQRTVVAVKRWLNSHTGWLLVFDNVEDLGLIKQFVPAGTQGTVLITTRRHITEPVAQAISLAPMSEEEGALFLLKRCKRLPSQDSPLFPAEYHQAVTISCILDGLPLALDQAGAYILETGSSLTDYLLLYEHEQAFLLTQRGSVPTEHPESVTTTFAVAFERIKLINPLALEVLTVCAYLAADDIPEELFTLGAPLLGPVFERMVANPSLFHVVLKDLLSYSLINRNTTKKTFSMHRLVQVVLKERLSEAVQHIYVTRILHTMNLIFPHLVTTANYWLLCEKLLPHAIVSVNICDLWKEETTEYISLNIHVASYFSNRARFVEAQALFQQVLEIQERILGNEHPLAAEIRHGFALLHCMQGKYEEAEPLFWQALHIRERVLGGEHFLVAEVLDGLASLYLIQEKLEEAEKLFLQASCIWKHTLNSEHPSAARSFNNLAELYKRQGKLEEAEKLLLQASRIWNHTLGSDHPNSAFAFNNLAELYLKQSKYKEAEVFFQRALSILESVLGTEHLVIAMPLVGLAELYTKQGKCKEAELLYQRTLFIRRQNLDPLNSDIAETLYLFARFYQNCQQPLKADSLYQEALTIYEQIFGPDHAKTTEIRDHYIQFLEALK